MIARRWLAAVTVLVGAAAAAGCGIGAGEGQPGEATLIVTRDYGTQDVLETTVEDPTPSDTVIRVLDREAEIATRHGGGFVQSIEGIAGGTEGGRSHDWFFYVNGIESPLGAAEVGIEPGDRIWWDHHDWSDVMRVPAVVGSFPQPFEAAAGEEGDPIEIGCATEPSVCESATAALEDEGIGARTVPLQEADPGGRPRVLVGELRALADDPVARLLDEGPERSGVFARPTGDGAGLELLDTRGATRHSGSFGLIAAMAAAAQAPTWLVSGTDADLVSESAQLLSGALLHNRFALALGAEGETIELPVVP